MDKPNSPEVAPDDYPDIDIDDTENPEWSHEDFANARPLSEVLPDLYRALMSEPIEVVKLKAS